MKYSQLIIEKIWPPLELCIHVSVCSQWCFRLQRGKEDEWQWTGCSTVNNRATNSELSHTLRRGMPLEVGVAHSACLVLVCISVCAHHGRLFSSLFSCTPECKNVQVWIICLSLAESSRIREGMDVFFFLGWGGVGGSDEKGFYMKWWCPWVRVSECGYLSHAVIPYYEDQQTSGWRFHTISSIQPDCRATTNLQFD